MYRLIFVDDEDIVREGITSRIGWDENGFELSGVFENGVQALDFLSNNQVDVVLSDISMPRMDGIALSREIASHYPDVHVILLTGYDEFEYAQKALQYHVKELLLKPITAAELEEALGKARDELERERDRTRQQEVLQQKLRDSYPLLRERFFNRLISGRMREEDIASRSEFLQWNNLDRGYAVVLGEISESWDDITRLSLTEELHANIDEYDEMFTNREEHLVVLLQGPSEATLEQRSRAVGAALFRVASGIRSESVSVGVGDAVLNLNELPLSYNGARSAADYSHMLGLHEVFHIRDVRSRERLSPEEFVELSNRLSQALRQGASGVARDTLEEIFTVWESRYLSSDVAIAYLARLNFHLIDFIINMNLMTPDLSDRENLLDPRFPEDLPGARTTFLHKVARIEELVRQKRADAAGARIDRAKQIINRRFSEPDFSLQDICNELYMSVSQFSAIFKEGTSQTFVEYLTACRIEKARELLKTSDLRTYEVAQQVGYRDSGYFSQIFKRLNGMTTSEYRKSLGGNTL